MRPIHRNTPVLQDAGCLMIGMMTGEDGVIVGQHFGQQTSGKVPTTPSRRFGTMSESCLNHVRMNRSKQPDGSRPPQTAPDTQYCRDCSGLRSV